MKDLVTEMRNEPALDPSLPVLVPGDPEKQAQEIRIKNGIPLVEQTVARINDLVVKHGLSEKLLPAAKLEEAKSNG